MLRTSQVSRDSAQVILNDLVEFNRTDGSEEWSPAEADAARKFLIEKNIIEPKWTLNPTSANILTKNLANAIALMDNEPQTIKESGELTENTTHPRVKVCTYQDTPPFSVVIDMQETGASNVYYFGEKHILECHYVD